MNSTRTVAVLLSCVLTLAASTAEAALVSHWRLDDGAPSQTATDSAGANPATLGSTAGVDAQDPTWATPGLFGPGALSFNGSQYAGAPDSASLDVSTGITLSAWFRRGRTGTREIFLGKGDGGGPGSTTSYWLEITAGNAPQFYLGQPIGPGGDHLVTGGTAITDTTTWHHMVGTYNGAQQKLYLDGVLLATVSWSGTILNSATQFSIGRLGNYGGLFFSGRIDDVGLWNTALNDGEAIALYNLGSNPTFGFDLGKANQVFAVYEAQSAPIYLGGYRWEYRTGLTGPLGVPTPDGLGNYLLKLDGGAGAGAGLVAAVPEPGGLVLSGLGGLLGAPMLARWRRRRGRD